MGRENNLINRNEKGKKRQTTKKQQTTINRERERTPNQKKKFEPECILAQLNR